MQPAIMRGVFGADQLSLQPAIRGRMGNLRFYKAIPWEEAFNINRYEIHKVGHGNHVYADPNCNLCDQRTRIEQLFESISPYRREE